MEINYAVLVWLTLLFLSVYRYMKVVNELPPRRFWHLSLTTPEEVAEHRARKELKERRHEQRYISVGLTTGCMIGLVIEFVRWIT